MKAKPDTVTELKTLTSHATGHATGHGPASAAPVVARIVDSPEPGILLVQLAEADSLRARMTASLAALDVAALLGREALLLFEGNDPGRPIAVALLHSPFGDAQDVTVEAGDDLDFRVDGRRVVIQAEQTLELRCGKASIVIDADGKVTIRGTHLLSRSTGPIRIKGGHVDIN